MARWDQSLSHVRKLDCNPGQPRGTRGLHFSFSNTHLLWYWLIVVLAPPSRAPRARSWAHSHFQSQKRVCTWHSPLHSAVKNNLGKYFSEGAQYHSHATSLSREHSQMCTVSKWTLESSARDQPPLLTQTKAQSQREVLYSQLWDGCLWELDCRFRL